MIPGRARGDMAPAWAPLPTTRAIRRGEIPTSAGKQHGRQGQQSRSRDLARPHGREAEGQEEKDDRQHGHISTNGLNGILGYFFQGAINLRNRKKVSDPGQQDEQAGGIPLDDVWDLHPADIIAHDQR